jgi:hypothetical protein
MMNRPLQNRSASSLRYGWREDISQTAAFKNPLIIFIFLNKLFLAKQGTPHA